MKNETKHGCCEDKRCTKDPCMQLPEGKTCGNCIHEYRCCLIFGHVAEDTFCDWFPRKFKEKQNLSDESKLLS